MAIGAPRDKLFQIRTTDEQGTPIEQPGDGGELPEGPRIDQVELPCTGVVDLERATATDEDATIIEGGECVAEAPDVQIPRARERPAGGVVEFGGGPDIVGSATRDEYSTVG